MKIRAHYYDVPDWQRLTWRGTASLDIALTHDTFRQRYLPSVSDEQINLFRQQLRTDINQRVVRSNQDALRLVAYAAHEAAESLQLSPVRLHWRILLRRHLGAGSSIPRI